MEGVTSPRALRAGVVSKGYGTKKETNFFFFKKVTIEILLSFSS